MFNYDMAVYIGRFQPFHNAHAQVIHKALETSERLLILIGSSHAARNTRNPFTFVERKKMIENSLPDKYVDRVIIKPLRDFHYNDQPWIAQVQSAVEMEAGEYDKIVLVHPNKDDTTYYLKLFPQWGQLDIPIIKSINASDIRTMWFEQWGDWHQYVPRAVYLFMDQHNAYPSLKDEYFFLKKYREQWESSPYPPTFVTVDAVTICNGHILLVRRGAMPGKNLWALPGGFLDASERIEDSVVRELKEETRIKVPKAVLMGSITRTEVFDAPMRSLRGRTITHAHLIELKNEATIPRIKGGDDAKDACWIPLADFLHMETEMFEDHFYIICIMLGISF